MAEDNRTESRPLEGQTLQGQPFQADVAKLLQLMVHSVYSDKSVFLRELISNAADACERLRYEAIADPALLGDDVKPRITVAIDADKRLLTVEDNGIGMSRDEMVEALGTIARSGTKAFLDRIEAAQGDKGGEETALIGRFGVGFYSAFMVAERVDVISRRAGSGEAWLWSSDGKGAFAVSAADPADAPRRGTRVVLHLLEDAKSYAERFTIERLVKAQSGHVPVPIAIIEKPGAEAAEISRWRGAMGKAESRNHGGRLHGLLPEHCRAVRRAGADRPFPRRRPAGLYDAALRARIAAVRPVRSRPQGPHQALRQARLYHRRSGNPAALSAVRSRSGRQRRSAAQCLARKNPGKPAPCRDQEGRDEPGADANSSGSPTRSRRLTQRYGRPSAPC